MSPVAETLHVSEVHLANIGIPRAPLAEAQHKPSQLSVDRVRIGEVFPGADVDAGAMYILSHQPLDVDDDPIDGVGTVDESDDQADAVLVVEFPQATDDASRHFFIDKSVKDIRENVLGFNGNVRVVEVDPREKQWVLHGLAGRLAVEAA